MGVVCPKVGVASQILRALRAHECTTTPLLEILDPPLQGTNFLHCYVCSGGFRGEFRGLQPPPTHMVRVTVAIYLEESAYDDVISLNCCVHMHIACP